MCCLAFTAKLGETSGNALPLVQSSFPQPICNMKFWRQAGLSYLRYLNYSSKVVRAAVKDAVQKEGRFSSRETATLTWRTWTDGKKNPAGTLSILHLLFVFSPFLAVWLSWNVTVKRKMGEDLPCSIPPISALVGFQSPYIW